MATSDLGHKMTNKELAKLERRIAKLYREAGKELQATIDAYFEQFKKRDEEMKALADKGGVMGIYMLPFLTPDSRQPTLADYMQHMVHALKICGEDHVGIGTDSMFFTVTGKDLKAIEDDEAHRRKIGVGAPGENRPPYIPDCRRGIAPARVWRACRRQGARTQFQPGVQGNLDGLMTTGHRE